MAETSTRPAWRRPRLALVALMLAFLVAQVTYAVRTYLAEVYRWRGTLAYQQGNPRAAGAELEKALSWNPRDYRVMRTLAIVQRDLNEPAAATETLEAMLRLAPNDVATLLDLAAVYARDGAMSGAEESLRRARSILPNYWRVNLLTGIVAGIAGEHEKAAEAFENALTQEQADRPLLLQQLAVTHFGRDSLDAALAYANESALLDAQNPETHVLRGQILMRMGRTSQGVAALSKAVELLASDPSPSVRRRAKLAEYCGYLCEAQRVAGQPLEASQTLFRLVSLDPRAPMVRALAFDVARRYAAEPPQNVDSGELFTNLGAALVLLEEYREADKTLALAEGRTAPSAEAWRTVWRARSFMGQGRYAEAEALLRAANPENAPIAEIPLAYARALSRLGNLSEARRIYTVILTRYALDDATRRQVRAEMAALPQG